MIENILLHEIKDNVAWIIELCFGEKKLYTLHYDAERSASVLHTSENAVAFASIDKLIALCHEKHLNLIDGERISRSFNFDIELETTIPCKAVLENWNLLTLISEAQGEDFEGAKKEYESLLNYIFDHASSDVAKLDLDERKYAKLLRVFEGKDEILSKIEIL